jgi:hypothetical protein
MIKDFKVAQNNSLNENNNIDGQSSFLNGGLAVDEMLSHV